MNASSLLLTSITRRLAARATTACGSVVQQACGVRAASTDASTRRTALYELHVRYGGKMVQFADHWLPLQYKKEGIGESHLHIRQAAGIFDVSHMLQTEVSGEHAEAFLESVCVADLNGLPAGFGTLSVFTNESGGIIDDLIVSRMDDKSFYVVSNAACAAKVRKTLEDKAVVFTGSGRPVRIDYLNDQKSLVALQGPKAKDALQKVLSKTELCNLYFMHSLIVDFEQTPVRVTRCGYTGEDGFELSVMSTKADALVSALLTNPNVKLAGLGARDSLRLEAGLCLYGNDIDETTTPVEAGLVWTIGKRRRLPEAATFPGAERILAQVNKQQLVTRKRIGLKALDAGPPARQGALVQSGDGEQIGQVTSGCPSPLLKQNIAIAYVSNAHAKLGTQVNVQIRNKTFPYEVVKMPFVPTHYYLPPKK